MDLFNSLTSIRGAVQQGSPTDTTLDTYYVILRNKDGEMVDKQHFSRFAELVFGYIVNVMAYDFANIILDTTNNGTN